MVSMRPVTQRDREFWLSMDGHTNESRFGLKVFGKLGYVIFEDEAPRGFCTTRYCGTTYRSRISSA